MDELKILVQLSANESGIKDLAGNIWTYHKKEITRVRDEENYEEESDDVDLTIEGRFSDTSEINLNKGNWMSCNREIILPYNEKWFIYLWNYKTDFTDYDVILGGSNAKYYSLQNKDGEYADSIGMRIEGQGYSIKSLTPQETYKWIHYYIDCNGSGTFSLYINGEIQQRLTRKQDIIFKSLNLGAWSYGTCKEGSAGFIDDFIIAKGEQMYTTDSFEIPNEKFSISLFNRVIDKSNKYVLVGKIPENQLLYNIFIHS